MVLQCGLVSGWRTSLTEINQHRRTGATAHINPVHIRYKVEFNTADFVVLLWPRTHWRQSRPYRQQSWQYRQQSTLLPICCRFYFSVTVNFQQSRPCWIKLCRQSVPGYRGVFAIDALYKSTFSLLYYYSVTRVVSCTPGEVGLTSRHQSPFQLTTTTTTTTTTNSAAITQLRGTLPNLDIIAQLNADVCWPSIGVDGATSAIWLTKKVTSTMTSALRRQQH